MERSDITQKVIKKLREDNENNYCFDCVSPDPEYASVTFGIFLCSRCAQAHSSIHPFTEILKLVEDKTWTSQHLRHMAAGGNSALREYFTLYSFNHLTPIETKYRSKAAHYYKKRLTVISEGKIFEAGILRPEEGLKQVDENVKIDSKDQKTQKKKHTGIRRVYDSAMDMTISTKDFAISLVRPALNTIEETA